MGISILTDRTAKKFETITVATTAAVTFNATTITQTSGPLKNNFCKEVFCTLEKASIRFRYDGGTPSSTVGHPLSIGQSLTLADVDNIRNFKAITEDVSATLNDLGKLTVTYNF